MNKFNQVYNKIKNNISIIVEDFNNNNSLLTSGTFDFKTDPDNNIICTFSMNNNGNKIIVVAKFINNELTFNITENNGESINLSEKEFAVKYYKDYDEFKKALNNYLNKTDDVIENDGIIKSMDSEMKDETIEDPSIKYEKEFEIDNSKFLFKLLNDLAVENYCECIFDFQNESNETIYVRSLLNIMVKNSVIIKLLLFNEKGELLEKMTKTEFSNKYHKKYVELTKAIKKMEMFVAEQ